MGSSQCSSSASPPPNPFPSSPLHILPPSIDPVPISDPQRPQFWCRNQTPVESQARFLHLSPTQTLSRFPFSFVPCKSLLLGLSIGRFHPFVTLNSPTARGGVGEREVLCDFRIGVLEQEVVVDEGLAGNDAEEMNQALGGVSDVGAYGVAAGGGVEDGKVDVGVRVFEETPVLMPALPGANGAQDGD
nr:AAA+ ATPase domain-containing protein [Ipomoea batatas]